MIEHSRPTLGPLEAEAASRVIMGGHVSEGPETRAFETELAAFTGLTGTVAVPSGLLALYLALKALGLPPASGVIMPTYVCREVYDAVRMAGHLPVLADIGPDFNIRPDDAMRLTRLGGGVSAMIVPHMFGGAAPMEALLSLGLPVIEDCANSLGNPMTGARGAISVHSFEATKLMATGQGGALGSTDPIVLERIRALKGSMPIGAPEPQYNLKFTDVQAAMGRVQLRRLPDFIGRRREIAALYDSMLGSADGITIPWRDASHVSFRYMAGVPDAGAVMRRAQKGGVMIKQVVPLLHRALGLAGFEQAERVQARFVSLPIYPSLTDDEARRVARALLEAI